VEKILSTVNYWDCGPLSLLIDNIDYRYTFWN